MRLSEDQLTETLAEGLNHHSELMAAFLSFLFAGKVPPEILTCDSIDAVTQYRFSEQSRGAVQVGSRGRLDLLIRARLRNEVFAVGVEHKVWDEEKPSRLHNYRLLLNGEAFKKAWLFEIVREKDYDIEGDGYVDKVHRWLELHNALATQPSLSPSSDTSCRRICSAIEKAGGLVKGTIQRKASRALQITPSAEACVDALIRRFDGFSARKVRDKGLPVHIRAALPVWAQSHSGRWHERLWIYTVEQAPSSISFQLQVIFHNANFTDFDFAASRLREWGRAFEKAGMIIWRGPDRGWDGAKRIRVNPPYVLNSRPKYFYAEEPLQIACETTSSSGMDNLLDSAYERALRYAELFTKVY